MSAPPSPTVISSTETTPSGAACGALAMDTVTVVSKPLTLSDPIRRATSVSDAVPAGTIPSPVSYVMVYQPSASALAGSEICLSP